MKKKSTLLIICLCAGISLLANDPGYLNTTLLPSNSLTITKASDNNVYTFNAVATFTVTITNNGSSQAIVDKITDEIPAGFTYQGIHSGSQVTPANSFVIPGAGATGTITFEGGIPSTGDTTYAVPAGGSIILKYTAIAPNYQAFNLVTTANGYEASNLIGPAQNTVSVSLTLPVALLSFNAAWQNETVKLNWSVTNDVNSGVTDIERSTGAGAFVKIGELPAAGSSSSVQSYSFTDVLPATGANKYRLKLTDRDGHYKYSPIVLLTKKQSGITLVNSFPNPLTDELNIQVTADKSQPVQLRLTDITGRIVLTRNENCVQGTNTVILNNLSTLRAGTYLLQVITAGGSQEQKIVKSSF